MHEPNENSNKKGIIHFIIAIIIGEIMITVNVVNGSGSFLLYSLLIGAIIGIPVTATLFRNKEEKSVWNSIKILFLMKKHRTLVTLVVS